MNKTLIAMGCLVALVFALASCTSPQQQLNDCKDDCNKKLAICIITGQPVDDCSLTEVKCVSDCQVDSFLNCGVGYPQTRTGTANLILFAALLFAPYLVIRFRRAARRA